MILLTPSDTETQDALSRRYGNDSVIFLLLRSGRTAVFNRAFELQGVVEGLDLPKVQPPRALWFGSAATQAISPARNKKMSPPKNLDLSDLFS